VRTRGSPVDLAAAVRAAVRETDPRLRITGITTLAQRVDRKLGVELLVADITGFFGGLTLLLVSVGIYGTVAYAVAARTNEIGIRMALGARPASVLRAVLRDVVAVLAVGLAAGVAAALAGGRMVGSMLFGLGPADLTTMVLAALVLSVTCVVAGYIPARRASRVDPMSAMRAD
jgi:ABC-type antimicrobial peptide transport system permease subunit